MRDICDNGGRPPCCGRSTVFETMAYLFQKTEIKPRPRKYYNVSTKTCLGVFSRISTVACVTLHEGRLLSWIAFRTYLRSHSARNNVDRSGTDLRPPPEAIHVGSIPAFTFSSYKGQIDLRSIYPLTVNGVLFLTLPGNIHVYGKSRFLISLISLQCKNACTGNPIP